VLLAAALAIVLRLVPGGRAAPSPGRWSFQLPPGLGSLIVARFLFLFATYAVGRFLVLLVAERLGIAPGRAIDEAGWLLALFTLATALGAIPCGWLADRRSRTEMMVVGAVVSAVGVVALAPSAGLVGVIAGGMLMSLGTAAFVTGNWAATTALVPAADAGRLMAIANLGTGLAAATAGMLGPLIDATGFAPALLVAAGACAASVAPLLARLPRIRQARRNAA
jgi:MFS family permease